MTSTVTGFLRIATTLLATLIVSMPALWGGFALWYQAPGGQLMKALSIAVWVALTLATFIALWQDRALVGLVVFAMAFAGLLFWWRQLPASNDRQWSDDVARITHGTIEGNRVTLRNVRNFDWRTLTDYTQRWETRTYDLEHMQSVDMIMSYWGVPSIAHMLISFGFTDGSQVAFSVEIRREKSEAFSMIGGFFKEFEVSIIAADERDVVRTRTNVRGEEDFLYRLRMPVPAMRSLFLGYLAEANDLVDHPRWYNTITVNCTTLVYHMMKRIVGHLPFDYRLLFTGHLPKYVYKVRGLDQRYTLEELRAFGHINERARQSDRSDSFAADIRRGIPLIPPEELPVGLPSEEPASPRDARAR